MIWYVNSSTNKGYKHIHNIEDKQSAPCSLAFSLPGFSPRSK